MTVEKFNALKEAVLKKTDPRDPFINKLVKAIEELPEKPFKSAKRSRFIAWNVKFLIEQAKNPEDLAIKLSEWFKGKETTGSVVYAGLSEEKIAA